jgi:hypothetical protein
MQFALTERKAKITAVNPNRELHGEDPQAVCYIRMNIALLAADLAMFHPSLRHFIYGQAAAPDLVQQSEGGDSGIRFQHLDLPLKWTDECVGAEVRVHWGATAKSHIVLAGCLISKFSLEPMEGGTVVTSFMITSHPTEAFLGRLGMMVGTEVVISIVPPKDNPDAAEAEGQE